MYFKKENKGVFLTVEVHHCTSTQCVHVPLSLCFCCLISQSWTYPYPYPALVTSLTKCSQFVCQTWDILLKLWLFMQLLRSEVGTKVMLSTTRFIWMNYNSSKNYLAGKGFMHGYSILVLMVSGNRVYPVCLKMNKTLNGFHCRKIK